MKKAICYIGYIFRDCYRAFPGFFVLSFALDTVGAVTAVLTPLFLAQILELAGSGQGVDGGRLLGTIGLYGLCLACTPVGEVIFRACSKKARILGDRYFGKQLVAFSAKIQLEALENPETLNKFKRAEWGKNGQFNFFEQFTLTLRKAITCIGMVMVVGRYSPILVLTGLLSVFPSLLTKIYFEKKLTALRRGQSGVIRRSEYLRSLFSDRESVKEMRVMGFGEYLRDKWKESNAERVQEFFKTNLDIRKKQVLGIIVINLCYAFNIGLSFYLMVQGYLSIGAFAACLTAFSAYDESLSVFIAMMFNAIHTYHMVEDYYDYFTIPTEVDGSETYRPFAEEIVADHVCFRYCGSESNTLKGLNCRIKKGEHVVIVGENGSGKTTFAKLLTGAYLPSEGSISYDGQRTQDLKRKSLYDHISVVPQDFVQYQFSLRENIGISDIGRMEDSAAMEELLDRVTGSDFLNKLGGLDVQLGREFGGQELSGGEWQKIAIARGLWKESDIIILDEPTSALDPLIEYDILSKFVEMIKDKTSVIISHRVGLCRTADKIIVMKDGRMVECGQHEELLRNKGEYARIWQEQAKWYV